MAAALCGKWSQSSSENYGALLDALGVPGDKKDVFLSDNAELEIGNEGDTWTMKITLMGKTREDKFKLGEETDGVSIIDSAPLKFTITLDGEALVEVSRTNEGRETKTRRYIEGGQLITQYTMGDVTASLKLDKV